LAEKPPSPWKRFLDIINATRAVEWVGLKLLVLVGLVSATTWQLIDIASLPLLWRVVIAIAIGIGAGTGGLFVLAFTELRRHPSRPDSAPAPPPPPPSVLPVPGPAPSAE